MYCIVIVVNSDHLLDGELVRLLHLWGGHATMYVCMYVCVYLSIYLSIYICVCIYIYIYVERERERERERDNDNTATNAHLASGMYEFVLGVFV